MITHAEDPGTVTTGRTLHDVARPVIRPPSCRVSASDQRRVGRSECQQPHCPSRTTVPATRTRPSLGRWPRPCCRGALPAAEQGALRPYGTPPSRRRHVGRRCRHRFDGIGTFSSAGAKCQHRRAEASRIRSSPRSPQAHRDDRGSFRKAEVLASEVMRTCSECDLGGRDLGVTSWTVASSFH